MTIVQARACANIALAKYWGKSDIELNLPAVPSISMTLDGLVTETEVEFDDELSCDLIRLNGEIASEKESRRVVELLDRIRAAAATTKFARVASQNHFPTAAGLASSASGFAALAAAASRAAGLEWTPAQLSAAARQSSASAARSIFGGYVELGSGAPGQADLAATPIAGRDYWDLRIVVAQTAKGPKKVGSTEGMERSRLTSPLYQGWIEGSVALTNQIREAIADRNLDALGPAMEQSTLSFHSCALSSNPPILYWQPATIAALQTVHSLREHGISVWATMDAGPHVKALCDVADAPRVESALRETPGVLSCLVAGPGPGIQCTEIKHDE